MAFATKIVNRELELDSCKPLLKPENAKSYAELKDLLKPAVKEVIVGVGDKAKKIGGKLVMYRHEFTYKNPTAIAIDVTDEMPDATVISRVQHADNFTQQPNTAEITQQALSLYGQKASPRPVLCWTRPARAAAGRRVRIWAICTTMETACQRTAHAPRRSIPRPAVHLRRWGATASA